MRSALAAAAFAAAAASAPPAGAAATVTLEHAIGADAPFTTRETVALEAAGGGRWRGSSSGGATLGEKGVSVPGDALYRVRAGPDVHSSVRMVRAAGGDGCGLAILRVDTQGRRAACSRPPAALSHCHWGCTQRAALVRHVCDWLPPWQRRAREAL